MATFSASAFRAAAPGLGSLASAIGGGSFEKGQQDGITYQSKLANAIAEAQAHSASARLNNAKADGEELQTQAQRPEAIQRNAMTKFGIPLEDESTLSSYLKTGKPGPQYAAPADGIGPTMAAPSWAGAGPAIPELGPSKVTAPNKLGEVARAIAGVQTALALGDKNSENVAKAGAIDRTSRLSDEIIAGTANRNTVGGAQAAAGGKALFHSGENGTVLDQFTGDLNESGGLARGNIALKGAQAGQAKAAAANSYASAGQHNAQTKKINQEVEQGVKTGAIQVITDNDGNVSLLNKITGIARPATTAEGEAFVGKGPKLKDIPATANGKIIEGQQGVTNVTQAIKAIKENPGAFGFSNAIPGAQLVKQLWASPGDIGARAQVANIGSLKLHDRSGAAVSASEFPRLAPFIPSASDTPDAAIKKLEEMQRIAEEELGLYADTYGPENGYRESKILKASKDAKGGFKYLGKEK